ncbi:MAG: hypothetical protein VXW31_08195, partial [Planctomycetota bacterium]|nr:hypothetical protein [Planctomycetota bacterium]
MDATRALSDAELRHGAVTLAMRELEDPERFAEAEKRLSLDRAAWRRLYREIRGHLDQRALRIRNARQL